MPFGPNAFSQLGMPRPREEMYPSGVTEQFRVKPMTNCVLFSFCNSCLFDQR